MKKRLVAIALVICLAFSISSCSFYQPGEEPASDAALDWVIYWYLCGSDLESDGGFASMDLDELMEVQLPENVKVVIETGGTTQWQNDYVDGSLLQRYVYDSQGLKLVDEQPLANMGEAETLADFLSFAKTNFPAANTAVTFWNHGGGSVSGAAFDELYDLDSLTLDEMYAAFSSVWQPNSENPPIDMVGFDTCLMATVDVAYTFEGLASYMVASEELEPANGWQYSKWLGALAENPNMGPAELGTIICDTYGEGCRELGTADDITLSLIDLSKLPALLEAYETFGIQALSAACEDPGFFSKFGRAAERTENYGGNTKEQGYTNMLDLGHLAKQVSLFLPESSAAVLKALRECVVYRISGPYRAKSNGLSCYYSYNADIDDFNGFADVGASTAFKYYYAYGLTGELDEEGMDYIQGLDYDELPRITTLLDMQWDGIVPEVNDQGAAVLKLGTQARDILSGIGFQLYYVDEENDIMLLLGTDNDLNADWDAGVFSDNFRGVWGAIDGCLVYMELSFEGDDYNLYSVPVLINGEEYNLQVVYDFTAEHWAIQGARRPIDENGMADKELRLLAKGDIITTLHYATTLSGSSEELIAVEVDTITVTSSTSFAEAELGDGDFVLIFEMKDAHGNFAYSEGVLFQCANGEITTSVAQ